MRLLHAARLSRLGDAATGLDKQDGAAQRYADAFGHTIVAVAADTDVSGSTRPQERPKLGPWLTNPALMAQYDGIVASHLDRLGRNVKHLAELHQWAEDNGKALITVEPNIDWSGDVGKLVWGIMSWLAEQELKAITRRSVETQKLLKDNGYLVGSIPYGFRAVAKDQHKTLEPIPELVPVIEGMVSRAIEGQSLTKICEWLDDAAPLANGKLWHPKTVQHILRNQALMGRRVDSTGKTVLRFEGVIDVATFKGLQAALDANSKKRGAVSEGPSLLTGVIFCAKCGRTMHRKMRTETRKRDNSSYVIATYRCSGTAREPSTCKNMVSMPALHGFIDEWFTKRPLAESPVVETVLTPGNGYADELEQNARDVAELDLDDPDYMEKLAVLRQERKRLQALPAQPDVVETRTIGVVRDRWLMLDESEKRTLLMDSGIRIEAVKASVVKDDAREASETGEQITRQIRPGTVTTHLEPANDSRHHNLLRDYLGALTDVQDGIRVTVYFPAELSAKVTGSIVMTRPTVAV